MSAILISAQSIRCIGVQLVEDLADSLLRLVGAMHVVVQVGDVVARLVAMRVLANKAGDVGLLPAGSGGRSAEQSVELGFQSLCPSMQGDQAFDILGRVEGVLPGIRFGKVEIDLGRIEGLDPLLVHPRPEKAGRRIEEILVVLRAPQVGQVVVGPTQGLGHLRNAPIVVGVLERLGHRLRFGLGRDIAVLAVGRNTQP